MAGTTTTLAYALKKVYSPRDVENAVYKDNPLLAMIAKNGNFVGESFVHAIRHRDQLGRSPTFATAQTRAQAAAGASKGKQFVLTRVKDYQVYTLETEVILAGRSDLGALVRTLSTEVDSALNNIGRIMGIRLYRDGCGELGQVSAVSGSGPYVFTVGEAVTNIEVGMTVCFSTGSTKTAALRNSGGGVDVTVVDRAAGTFSAATNPDSGAANDWVFIKGDRAAGSVTSADYLNITGLDGWVPATAPAASESFFGVDRSEDPTRLGGQRLDISSYNPEEGLVLALNRLAREGGNPDAVFMSFLDVTHIQNALGSKVETEYKKIGDVGFSTIRVTGPKGDVSIVPDQNCPVNVGWFLTMSTWELKHLGDLFNLIDLDGARLSREASADRFEGRVNFYGNALCYAPGRNMRCVLPS